MMYRDSAIIDVSYCKMHLKCVHMHSNEWSKYMCVMEQKKPIHYNLYTHNINVQQRVTIFNLCREYTCISGTCIGKILM